jgi:sensor histidine kinase regulating citrate/malate metabolism
MKIKTKILLTLLGMSLLLALVGALAIDRQYKAAMISATKEAEDVARVLSFLLTSDSRLSESAQEIVAKLHETQGRDVVLMDTKQLVLADADPSEVGKFFEQDEADEVGSTINQRNSPGRHQTNRGASGR